ncbi:MAG: hypothetical protein ACJA0V_004897, partial [Planctomycetota bacterium]
SVRCLDKKQQTSPFTVTRKCAASAESSCQILQLLARRVC